MIDATSAQIAANRAAMYRWFALAFFAPPTENDVVDMREGKAQQFLHALTATPGASLGVQTMSEVLTSGTPVEVASELGAAHAKLFYGAGGYESASPYRSVYSSDQGVLCQQATVEMERVLRQHRLRLQDTVCEPPDHLSIQLEVMAQLALRYAEAEQIGSDTLPNLHAEQADFLNTQLLSWLPAFSRRVVEVDDLGFHAGLASALQAVLEQDHAYLLEA
jgi:TorA-specific chaperone